MKERINWSLVVEWSTFAGFMLLGIFLWIFKLSENVVIDWKWVGDILSSKGVDMSIKAFALCGIAWAFDLITPGSYLRRISENANASAAFMAILVLSLALVIM